MATRIDGKEIAAKVREEVAERARAFASTHGRSPTLHVILVGDDPASAVYVRNKERAAEKAAINGAVYRMSGESRERDVLFKVEELNRDPTVDGILVQFPVPDHISQAKILRTIDPAKDVDGLNPINVGRLWSNMPGLRPCTPSGCVRLLEEAKVEIAGSRALVIGRSNLVGKPMVALLTEKNATATLAHSRTADLPSLCREADIVIAAVGRERIVKRDWIKPGAAVIDVGMNRGADGKLAGDVDYDAVEPIAGCITPVPGGVGPMTIAMLLSNTVEAAFARAEQD